MSKYPNHIPPIKGFIETSFSDWPGMVCAVIFLPYCNLRCPFCHNHVLVLNPDSLENISLQSILDRLKPFKDWIDGVCITGGEPTIHRGLPGLIRKIRSAGLMVKLDTNGTQPEILNYLISEGLLDFVAMDVKAPLNDSKYTRASGVYVPVEIIRESIETLMSGRVQYMFRTTVVPSLHSRDDILEIARMLKGALGLTLQNFNPKDPLDPQMRKEKPYSDEALCLLQKEVDRVMKSKN